MKTGIIKKIVWIVCSCMYMVAAAQQEKEEKKLETGIQFGPAISSARDHYTPATAVLQSAFGVFCQYNLNSHFSIRPEIGIEGKSYGYHDLYSTYENTNQGVITHVGETLFVESRSYLILPLLLRFSAGADRLRYFINAGGYYASLLDRKSRPLAVSAYIPPVKGYDYGATAGIGASLSFRDEKCFIAMELRDNLGLVNTTTHELQNKSYTKINSVNVLLGVGAKF